MAGTGLTIMADQGERLLGMRLETMHVLPQLWEDAGRLPEIHPWTFGIGLTTFVTLVVLCQVSPRFPGIFLVTALSPPLSWGLQLQARGVETIGAIPAGLPFIEKFRPPLVDLRALLPGAIALALLVDAEAVTGADVTSLDMLADFADELCAQGVTLAFARVHAPFYSQLQRAGLVARIGPQHFFRSVEDGVSAYRST